MPRCPDLYVFRQWPPLHMTTIWRPFKHYRWWELTANTLRCPSFGPARLSHLKGLLSHCQWWHWTYIFFGFLERTRPKVKLSTANTVSLVLSDCSCFGSWLHPTASEYNSNPKEQPQPIPELTQITRNISCSASSSLWSPTTMNEPRGWLRKNFLSEITKSLNFCWNIQDVFRESSTEKDRVQFKIWKSEARSNQTREARISEEDPISRP